LRFFFTTAAAAVGVAGDAIDADGTPLIVCAGSAIVGASDECKQASERSG
jgi:hypothetical protein